MLCDCNCRWVDGINILCLLAIEKDSSRSYFLFYCFSGKNNVCCKFDNLRKLYARYPCTVQ